jgi:chaperonin cofactor prefoldin|tara:strand:+ start:306 stop:488 length:183 start_codon:yes stop_codon:yes gene_type:complete
MVMTNKDCEELEKQLETLRFRNDVLHKANQKQQDEILDLRTKVKKLEHDAVQQFRNKGEM